MQTSQVKSRLKVLDYNDFATNYSLEGFPSYSYERQNNEDVDDLSASSSSTKNLKSASSLFSNGGSKKSRKYTSKQRSSRRSFGVSLIHATEKTELAFKKLDRRSVVATA
ncbi:unnamed protein product [Allacma fusca]|uniref:Uncharacterized protein n=1 Tax=Allacma fusca TaxID=39272 RepID=A0A8J2J503_9HEXA|nr:unnamed protein product [Allacma fusca]